MKTAVTITSLLSYDALRSIGLARCHASIIEAMTPGKLYSRRELAVLTGLETSSVAGRVNELVAADMLEVVGKQRCARTGRVVEVVRRVAAQMELV